MRNSPATRDLDIGIRPDAEPPVRFEKGRRRKHAVAEIGLGDRAEARDRARARDRANLVRVDMRRVNEAPAPIDRRRDRTASAPDARRTTPRRRRPRRSARRYGCGSAARPRARRPPQAPRASRRAASAARRRRGPRSRARGAPSARSAREGVEIVDEAALLGARGRAAEPRARIEHRQQREADARLGRGRADPLRHFRRGRRRARRRRRGEGSETRRPRAKPASSIST